MAEEKKQEDDKDERIRELEKENEMINGRIKELEEENKLLQAKEEQLTQDIEKIQNDITVLELKYRKILEENNSLRKERDLLKRELDEIDNENDIQASNYANLKEIYDNLMRRISVNEMEKQISLEDTSASGQQRPKKLSFQKSQAATSDEGYTPSPSSGQPRRHLSCDLSKQTSFANDIDKSPIVKRDLMNALAKAADKWNQIGIQLCIERSKLKSVHNKHNEDSDKLSDILDLWLDNGGDDTDNPLCWETIVRAVTSPPIDCKNIADEIIKKYINC